MISRSLTPLRGRQQLEGAGAFISPRRIGDLSLLLCAIECTRSDDTSADWRRVYTAGLGPFLFIPTRRLGVEQFAVDLPADVPPGDALRQLLAAPLSGPLRLRCVSTVPTAAAKPSAAWASARSPPLLPLLRVGTGGEVSAVNRPGGGEGGGEGGVAVGPVRAPGGGGGSVCLLQLLTEASAFGAALVERFAVGTDPLAERAARAVCFVRDFMAAGALSGGLADVIAAWAAVLQERLSERPEWPMGQSSPDPRARAVPRLMSVSRMSSPSGARNNNNHNNNNNNNINSNNKLGAGISPCRGGAGARHQPVLSVCDEVLAAAQKQSASSGAEGFLPELLCRLAEDATRQSKDVTGNEYGDKDTNNGDSHKEKKENNEFILDTMSIRCGDIYPTTDMIESVDLLFRNVKEETRVRYYDLDPFIDAEGCGAFSNATGGGGCGYSNATTGSFVNGHPCFLAITETDIILRSVFDRRSTESRLIFVIPRVSLIDVRPIPFTKGFINGVMLLQTRSCRRVWLAFLSKTTFVEALRCLAQCDKAPYKNLTLACAQRSWRMSALALAAGEVLTEPHEPFYQQALRNVLVAIAFVEDRRRRRLRRDRDTQEDLFHRIDDTTLEAIAGDDDELMMPMEKCEGTENVLIPTTHPHSSNTDNNNNITGRNVGTYTHVDKSDPTHWWLYSAQKEYDRQKVPPRQWKLFSGKRSGLKRQFPTYPGVFVVPHALTDEGVIHSANVRRLGRVEALTFFYNMSRGGIVRRAQPLEGNSNTPFSSASGIDVKAAYKSACGTQPRFLDLRSRLNAYGSTLIGGGFNMNAGRFCDLGNIHAVRNAYEALCNDVLQRNPSFLAVISAANAPARPGHGEDNVHFRQGHGEGNHDVGRGVSDWLHLISTLLRTSVHVARLVSGLGEDETVPPVSGGDATGSAAVHVWTQDFTNISHSQAMPPLPASYRTQRSNLGQLVVLNCSDGWDRTPQVCALAQMLLDPYYRTAEGFLALIEKEFVAFGHPSLTRATVVLGNIDEPYGNGSGGGEERTDTAKGEYFDAEEEHKKNPSQCSPILLQFLDAAHQLVRLYPNCFEITDTFLLLVVDVMHAGIVGNFAVNCEADVERWNVAEETLSLAQLFAVLLATTIPSSNSDNTCGCVRSNSDPSPPQHNAPVEFGSLKGPPHDEAINNGSPRHPHEDEEEPGDSDADGSLSMRLLLRIGGGGPSSSSPSLPSHSPAPSPLVAGGAESSWRRLPVSRDAMEHSGLLNPHFSMLENQCLIGPLLDSMNQSDFALWDSFFLRHSYWCERRLKLRRRRADNLDTECYKEIYRRAGVAPVAEVQTPRARHSTEMPPPGRPCGGGSGGITPRTLTRPASYAALPSVPPQTQKNHAHARHGFIVATVGGGQNGPRISSPNCTSVTPGPAQRQSFGMPPTPTETMGSSFGQDSMSSQSVEAPQQTRATHDVFDELEQAHF